MGRFSFDCCWPQFPHRGGGWPSEWSASFEKSIFYTSKSLFSNASRSTPKWLYQSTRDENGSGVSEIAFKLVEYCFGNIISDTFKLNNFKLTGPHSILHMDSWEANASHWNIFSCKLLDTDIIVCPKFLGLWPSGFRDDFITAWWRYHRVTQPLFNVGSFEKLAGKACFITDTMEVLNSEIVKGCPV